MKTHDVLKDGPITITFDGQSPVEMDIIGTDTGQKVRLKYGKVTHLFNLPKKKMTLGDWTEKHGIKLYSYSDKEGFFILRQGLSTLQIEELGDLSNYHYISPGQCDQIIHLYLRKA